MKTRGNIVSLVFTYLVYCWVHILLGNLELQIQIQGVEFVFVAVYTEKVGKINPEWPGQRRWKLSEEKMFRCRLSWHFNLNKLCFMLILMCENRLNQSKGSTLTHGQQDRDVPTAQGLIKGAILCFRNLYFYFWLGESTSTAIPLTSPASQISKDLNKVLLLLQDLEVSKFEEGVFHP